MHIVITGGAGFLGVRLARTILASTGLALDGTEAEEIHLLTLVDRVDPPPDLVDNPRIRVIKGDLLDLFHSDTAEETLGRADLIFHLAASVSAESEADFDLGMRANIDGGRAVLEACRTWADAPVVVFASSLAVYGSWAGQPLPSVVNDTTLPTPRSSYGIQKFVVEQLMTDYTRKGFIRGRTVRLMTVSVRPGQPNGAASSFLSGIIREPMAGIRATVPVSPTLAVALSSPERTVEGLIRAAEVSSEAWGAPTAINLPSITTTIAEMVGALRAVAGEGAVSLLDWEVDESIVGVVSNWPAQFNTARASGLGLAPDADFVAMVEAYAAKNL